MKYTKTISLPIWKIIYNYCCDTEDERKVLKTKTNGAVQMIGNIIAQRGFGVEYGRISLKYSETGHLIYDRPSQYKSVEDENFMPIMLTSDNEDRLMKEYPHKVFLAKDGEKYLLARRWLADNDIWFRMDPVYNFGAGLQIAFLDASDAAMFKLKFG